MADHVDTPTAGAPPVALARPVRERLVVEELAHHQADHELGLCGCGEPLRPGDLTAHVGHLAERIAAVLRAHALAQLLTRAEFVERAARTIAGPPAADGDSAGGDVVTDEHRAAAVRLVDELVVPHLINPMFGEDQPDPVQLVRDLLAARTVRGYLEVFDPAVPPGGWLCARCGTPVESETCAEHDDEQFVDLGSDVVVDARALHKALTAGTDHRARWRAVVAVLAASGVDVGDVAPMVDVHLPEHDVPAEQAHVMGGGER